MITDDRLALDDLFSLTYEDLRRRARGVLRSEKVAHLTPTTLVNECWLKLARSPAVAHTSPLHFRRIAARAMRQVLVEAARKRHAHSRGSGELPITFDESLDLLSPTATARDVLVLDEALDALERIAPRQYLLVEARFFGGLSFEECTALLGVSEATVMRDWRMARAWLAAEVRRSLHQLPVISGGETADSPDSRKASKPEMDPMPGAAVSSGAM